MGNLNLVTGYKGEAHVTAADQGSFNAAIFGAGSYVLNRGNKFAALVVSNNSIRIQDGDICMQGRHVRLTEGTYVDLAVENGAQGYKRNDLIVARYTKTAQGVEDCSLVVIRVLRPPVRQQTPNTRMGTSSMITIRRPISRFTVCR